MATFKVPELQEYPELSEETFGQMNNSFRVDDLQAAQPVAVPKENLVSITGISPETDAAWKAKGIIGPMEHARRMEWATKSPLMVGSGIAVASALQLNQVRRRLQEDKYGKNASLKQQDEETFSRLMEYETEKTVRGVSKSAQILEGASYLPSFMLDFFITAPFTGPVGEGAKVSALAALKAANIAATSTAAKVIGTGAAWGAAGAVRTAAIGTPAIAAKYLQYENELNLTPTEQGFVLEQRMKTEPALNFMKAAGSVYLDYWGEEFGKYVLSPAVSKLAGTKYMVPIIEKVTKAYSKVPGNKGVAHVFTKAGWDGYVSELGEEYFQKELSAAFGFDPFAGNDGTSPLDRMFKTLTDGDDLLVTMGVLAVPGAVKVGTSAGVNATVGMLDKYRAMKRLAGVEAVNKTYIESLPANLDKSKMQVQFDLVEERSKDAIAALPQEELSKAQIGELGVAQRTGKVEFEESKPAPERKLVDEIKATPEYQQADETKRLELLVRGRTADLDKSRLAIEERMGRLEIEIKNLNKIGRPDVAILEGKQKELVQLSKELMSVHAQIADTIDAVPQDLESENVFLKGEALGVLQRKAREVGRMLERGQLMAVLRNQRASEEERRIALVKYLQARLPGPENAKIREKYNLRSAKNLSEKKLQQFFKDIEALRETTLAKQLRERAEKLVDSLKPSISEKSDKKGMYGLASLQEVADRVIRIANMARSQAETEMNRVLKEMQVLEAEGLIESDRYGELQFEATMLSSVSGLESRTASQLEDAIKVLTKTRADLLTGRDAVQELRKAQRKAMRAKFILEFGQSRPTIKNPLRKFASFLVRNKAVAGVFNYAASNLTDMLREISNGKAGSYFDKMVVQPLEKASGNTVALFLKMNRPYRKALLDIYGIGGKNDSSFYKFITDRMSLKDTGRQETSPYLAERKLNNGEMKQFKLNRWQRIYWYAVAHSAEGEIDPVAMEVLTGENQLSAIRQQVEQKAPNADEDAVEGAINDRAKGEIKGNAIPSDVLAEIFADLTPQDKKFAMEMRNIFSSFWSLINPVFSRAAGVNLTQIESYIPWIRVTSQSQDIEKMFDEIQMIESHTMPFPSSVKERNANATAPFAEISIIDVFNNFTTVMSHWLATREITSRLQWMLKDPDMRAKINEVTDGTQDQYGKWHDGLFMQTLSFHLKGYASRGKSDMQLQIPAMEFLRNIASRFYLGFRPQTAIQQITSVFAALNEVGYIDFAKGIASFVQNPKAAYEILTKGMSMYNRHQNMTLELKEASDQIKEKGTLKAALLSNRAAYFMLLTADRGANVLGGWTVFKSVYDKTKDLKQAYAAFDSFVENLQQSGKREQQTAAAVGPLRLYAQFMGAIAQYARVYYRSWVDLVKNPSPETTRKWANTIVLFHVILPAARWYIASLFLPPPEDEEEEEKRGKKLQAEMMRGPFSGLWIIGDAIDMATTMITKDKGFDRSSAAVEFMTKTKRSLEAAVAKAMDEDATDEEKLASYFKAGKMALGLTTGTPSEIVNVAQVLLQQSNGDWDAAEVPGVLYGHSAELMNYHRRIYE